MLREDQETVNVKLKIGEEFRGRTRVIRRAQNALRDESRGKFRIHGVPVMNPHRVELSEQPR